MSVPVDLAAAVEQKVLHPALGRAHAAPVIAALADAAGWRHTEPGRQGSQDPLTLAHIAWLVVLPGYLQDREVIGGILAQMPEGEQRFLGRLARAHHGATRTGDVDAARGRLLRALDEMGRACRAASRDAEAHAETAWRMRAAIQDVEAFKSTAGQLHQAQRVLTSSSEHEGRPSRMILWISGMPIEARAAMLPGHLVLTPLDDLAASPRVEDRGLAELMALTVPPTGEPTAAQIEKHFQRVANGLEPLHVRELTDRETLGSINAAVQRLYQSIRSEQPLEASADTWASAAFDRLCTELTTLLRAPLAPVSDSSADIDTLRLTEFRLGQRANESYRDHLTAPESSGPPDLMIQNVVAHLKASVALVTALTDPQRPASATKTVMAALYGVTSTLPTLSGPSSGLQQ